MNNNTRISAHIHKNSRGRRNTPAFTAEYQPDIIPGVKKIICGSKTVPAVIPCPADQTDRAASELSHDIISDKPARGIHQDFSGNTIIFDCGPVDLPHLISSNGSHRSLPFIDFHCIINYMIGKNIALFIC